MKPHELKAAPGATKRRKRVGRGEASGKGKTAGRGTKGTKARNKVRLGFEGGQMPLARRVPKLKGFRPPRRTVYGSVNLSQLGRVDATEIGPEELRAAGLLRKRHDLVKVLGSGEIERAVTVRAHAFSETARQKIESAGGKAEIIEKKAKS
jgi:large subunit ribosomal protein L15